MRGGENELWEGGEELKRERGGGVLRGGGMRCGRSEGCGRQVVMLNIDELEELSEVVEDREGLLGSD